MSGFAASDSLAGTFVRDVGDSELLWLDFTTLNRTK